MILCLGVLPCLTADWFVFPESKVEFVNAVGIDSLFMSGGLHPVIESPQMSPIGRKKG